MPVSRLLPSSSVAPEFTDMTVVGAATAHEALSDASDSSYITIQLSASEPTKWRRGDLTDLPDGAGAILGTVINVRALIGPNEGNRSRLHSGDYPTVRLSDTLNSETAANYVSGSLSLGTAAQINALTYMAGADWLDQTVVNVRIFEINFDVDFNYINGVVVAMIFQWLGPLVAVGLHEMPRLSVELWRRSRVYLRPRELEAAWRELREHRHRRIFLARPVTRQLQQA